MPLKFQYLIPKLEQILDHPHDFLVTFFIWWERGPGPGASLTYEIAKFPRPPWTLKYFKPPIQIFEPTCVYALWAHMHRFLSVWLSVTTLKFRLDQKSLDQKSNTCLENPMVYRVIEK